MLESMQRIVDAGLGAVSMTRDRAEKMFEELVRRGQLEKTGKEQFVDDMVNAASRTRADLEELVAAQMHKVLTRLNLPTREDFSRLEAKVDQLLEREL